MIDGANRFQRFRHITLPLITPIDLHLGSLELAAKLEAAGKELDDYRSVYRESAPFIVFVFIMCLYLRTVFVFSVYILPQVIAIV
ncbi:MAG: hypothetical protein WAP91_01750 [Bacilli bacterium]|mgnify:CR=1 FL=1|jgi:ABC-type polysaccharide transport system permease subunit